MREGPRDALGSIEKKLAINEWHWQTPKVITVAAINPSVAMVFFKRTLQLGGVNGPKVYLGFCAT